MLNERQAGVAIEGVVRQEPMETSQLAVDTHGYTDFAMALARLLGFASGLHQSSSASQSPKRARSAMTHA